MEKDGAFRTVPSAPVLRSECAQVTVCCSQDARLPWLSVPALQNRGLDVKEEKGTLEKGRAESSREGKEEEGETERDGERQDRGWKEDGGDELGPCDLKEPQIARDSIDEH